MLRKEIIPVKNEEQIKAMVTSRQKRLAIYLGIWPIGTFIREGCKGPLRYYVLKSKIDGELYIGYPTGFDGGVYAFPGKRLDMP